MIDDYRKKSFYQIWVRSFSDGNGDGIGDLYGVYEKIDYIESLGVDGIWFSPLYPSPNADYGYDVADYKNIDPAYGDLKIFQKLLDELHRRNMYVIMDLVVNHTSDEHQWFKESKKSRNNKYSDYYIWRDPKYKNGRRIPPNNWYSLLEGNAWEYSPERDQYYLHLFAKKQPDLNMDNPLVREEVKSIMRFWLDMGVDGFREDVITFISKHPKLPDGLPFIPASNGMPYYKDGPRLEEYLHEFRQVCKEYNAIQIGETPMTNVKTALKYISGEERSLDMVFNFDHMMADCFMTEYIPHRFNLIKLKSAFSRWQYGLDGKGWNALYLENHDHPRVISRYGNTKLHYESGTALAVSYLFQQGTPFIYQGQEIGMTNIFLASIEEYVDVSSKNNFYSFHINEPLAKRLRRIHFSSRDSSRTPMQWNSEKYAGFSRTKPWFKINKNYKRINVEREDKDPHSILNFYRKCLALRREYEGLIYGSYTEHYHFHPFIYCYERIWESERFLIVISFSSKQQNFKFPSSFEKGYDRLLLCNYDIREGKTPETSLKPYEARLYYLKK
ncbi:MAG: alpha-glucosidase [Lachnospiraceae bacterium]|nr:alpha-glucosidase [Lachnospiraceae bacterium]